jgi:hypothetical protein
MDTVRFIHFLGSAMWIGGALAAMVLAIRSRGESTEIQAGLFRMMTQVHTLVIGPGALMTLGSGVMWTMWLSQGGGAEATTPSVGVWIMQATGLAGGALVLLVALPAALKLGGLAVTTEDGHLLPAFAHYRRRQMIVSSTAGILAVLSLFTGVVL